MKYTMKIMSLCVLFSLALFCTTCIIPNGNTWEGSQGAEGLAIPANITAFAMSPDSVYLSWEAVEGVDSYAVYSGTVRNGSYVLVTMVDERYFGDTSLNPSTTYFYKVAAVSADGTGPLSDPVQARTLDAGAMSLLFPPSGIAAEALSPRSIRVSWNAVSGGRYNVYRAVSYSGEKTKLNASPLENAVTTYTETGLTPATDYYYFLRTVNTDDAEGPFSPGIRISTPSNIDPSMPIPANVRAEAEGYTAIRISWNSSAGAVEYNVYVSATSGGTYTILTATAGLSYLHDNLTPGATRYYKISAVAANERESNASVPVSGSAKQIPVPSGLVTEALNYTELRLSWNSIDDALSYKIYGATSVNGSYSLIDEVNSAPYTHSGLGQNITYYYKVSAVVSVGEGGQSESVSGMPRQIPMPTGLTAEALSASEIRLSWNFIQDALSYKIYGSSSANGSYSLIDSVNSSPYIHGGLTQNTTYYYKISVTVSVGESGQSAAVNATTERIPITPSGATLAEQLAYIASYAGDGDVFDIVVNSDVYIGPTSVSTLGRNITVNIRSASPEDVKTIQLEGQGHLFSVDTGITLKLQDIVLSGHSNNTRALVSVGQGTLILNSGAKITGNTNDWNIGDYCGGGVRVNGGNLELNDGAEISRNNVTGLNAYGGAIYVENHGSVIIRGGIITENNVDSRTALYGFGGGIYITGNSTVTMSGGIISKNNAAGWNNRGGGINVENGSTFTKRAASGNGVSGIIYGSAGDNANITAGGGNAIYRNFGTLKQRNTTLGGYDEISTGNDVGWE